MADREQRALVQWGRELRRARQRLTLRRRLALASFGLALLAAPVMIPPTPRLVWNASRSAPLGFYAIAPRARIMRGDLVAARMPAGWRGLAARRSYLPASVPLVKRVGAIAGQTVCAARDLVTIDGRVAAKRRARDAAGRTMPWWHGCRRLGRSELLLLTRENAESFDGRYFGPSDRSDVLGRAVALWVR